MAKDILLFGQIWQYNAMFFFDQIKEATEDNPEEELVLRINSEGGSPDYSMSMIEKVREMQSQFSIKVGAQAHSSALFFLCYVDPSKTECLDTTQAILHRAAYPQWIEKGEGFKGSLYEDIVLKSNKDLEKAFRARVDVAVLESLPQFKDKNITLKDVFSMEGRIDVLLTGFDLKKIGLVSRVNKITPTKKQEIEAQIETFNKCQTIQEYRLAAQAVLPKEESDPLKVQTTMTIEKLKAEFPLVYAAIVLEGQKAEQARVAAWLAWQGVDAEAVSKGIKEGAAVDMQVISEMSAKALKTNALAAMTAENPGAIETEEVKTAKTAAQQKVASFEEETKKFLKA